MQCLIESGKLTMSEAKDFPEKNVITRALGVESNVIADQSIVPLNPGDALLLCSDGLTNFVDAPSILSVFKQNRIENVADLLVDAANAGGGGDNISVVIVSKERG